LIEKKGILKTPQICKDREIGSFLINRAKIGNKKELSVKQNKKILETMLNDLDKVKKSKSFELWQEEEKRKWMNKK